MIQKQDTHLTILTGEAKQMLQSLPAESVHCCVTSPPYWGLRDYGHAEQIGLETTPEAYVEALRAVLAEVWRVLRNDGTLWLNLGDSYASAWPCKHQDVIRSGSLPKESCPHLPRLGNGLKEKDLVGIPWMVALALRSDGWYLRSDIIWHKPNSLPESVRDRPTKAHEYMFLLSKSERYFYDAEAIKEPAVCGSNAGRKLRASVIRGEFGGKTRDIPGREAFRSIQALRNKRSVWTVPTKAYKGAHFATYPPELIRPCILAGTSARGCCPECGAPWKRITEKGEPIEEWKAQCGADAKGRYDGTAVKDFMTARAQNASAVKARILEGMREVRTDGWKQTCECGASEVIPCTVLDPFAGSGTTGQVALELGRRAVLIELNSDYVKLIHERCTTTPALAFAA